MLLTFTIESGVDNQDNGKIPTSTSASGFDTHFGLQFALWSLTSTLGFDSSLGGISVLLASRSSTALVFAVGLDVCFGLPCALRQVSSAMIQHWLVGAAPAQRAGAGTSRGRAPEPGVDGQSSAAGEQQPALLSNWQCQ